MRVFKKCLLVLGILLLILSGYIIFRSDTFIEDASTNHGWNLMLVNHTSKIPDNYKVILTKLDNGKDRTTFSPALFKDVSRFEDDSRG